MNKKETARLIKALEAQGFTAQHTGSGHWLVRNSAGHAIVTMAATPSDHRGWLNALSRLKRHGLVWPPPR